MTDVIVAIHHHMTHEEPRTLFSKGTAESLARGLRKTLDSQKKGQQTTSTK